MTETAYGEILASALQLLGKRVVVHWLDDEGEACGVVGTLQRIEPARVSFVTNRKVGKSLLVENCYACPELARVTFIGRPTG